jgi:hypothetical protein
MTACANAKQASQVLELLTRMQHDHQLVPDVTACADSHCRSLHRQRMDSTTVRVVDVCRYRTAVEACSASEDGKGQWAEKACMAVHSAASQAATPRGVASVELAAVCAGLCADQRGAAARCTHRSADVRRHQSDDAVALSLPCGQQVSHRYTSAIKACKRAGLEKNVAELQRQALADEV